MLEYIVGDIVYDFTKWFNLLLHDLPLSVQF